MFANESFDLIFHPVSNVFAPDIIPVWRECYRVLRHGGNLLAGFDNPIIYIFDSDKLEQGVYEVRYSLPYSDLTSLNELDLQRRVDEGWPLEFSHTLEEQLSGQIQAGFAITGFYEDIDPQAPISQYTPIYLASRATKL